MKSIRTTIPNIILGFADLVFSLVMITLGLRLILRLFAANAGAPFVSWLYDISDDLLYPFRGVFNTVEISPEASGMVFEFSTLFAMLVYMILFLLVEKVVKVVAREVE